MQPENSQPVSTSLEQFPLPPAHAGEHVPSLPPLETGIERGAERREQAAEAGARVADATAIAQPVVPVQQQPVITHIDPVQAAVSNSPLVAADEDLIEKEWVDKAKEIIEHTKHDPHARTQQVNELQRNYLQKRYSRAVGASE